MSRLLSAIGLLVTAVYLLVLAALVGTRWHQLSTAPLNELGDFLAGAFGPIAILWLILGFFQQGIELRQNTQALALQATELKNSVEQQRQLVEVSRQQVSAELEVIKYERERATKAAQPFFVIEGIGHMVSGGHGTYRAQIKNVGNTGTDVHLSFDPPMKTASPDQRSSWVHGETFTCSFEYVTNLAEGETRLSIRYTDALGTPGLQAFDLVAIPGNPNPSVVVRASGA